MTDITAPAPVPAATASDEERALATLFHKAERSAFFGPTFFLGHLGGFVRDRCPQAEERLPVVHVHLVGGEALEVCHIIGVGPAWIALAVREDARSTAMRTELVPYACIIRVTIRAATPSASRIGFDGAHVPRVVDDPSDTPSPAELLAGAAARGSR